MGDTDCGGILVWVILHKKNSRDHSVVQQRSGSNSNRMWRTPLAWQIAIFMGFQSFLFYVTISWLPEILHSHGISMETAGWMLSFTQLVGLPASFFIPVLAGRVSITNMDCIHVRDVLHCWV